MKLRYTPKLAVICVNKSLSEKVKAENEIRKYKDGIQSLTFAMSWASLNDKYQINSVYVFKNMKIGKQQYSKKSLAHTSIKSRWNMHNLEYMTLKEVKGLQYVDFQSMNKLVSIEL